MKCVSIFTLICVLFTFQFLPAQAPTTQWFKSYTLNTGWDNCFHCVQQTFDGGYIVAGQQVSFLPRRGLLMKTDAFGDTVWTKTFEPNTCIRSVQQTTDSGYIAVGYDRLIKTDGRGDTLWTKNFNLNPISLNCVQQTKDGGYIAIGVGYLIKTDEYGDTLWTKFLGSNWYAYAQQTQDEGYILLVDTTLTKINGSGDTLWTKSYACISDEGRCIQQTEDGGYIFVGHRMVIKTDSLGDSLWSFVNDPGSHSSASMNFVQQTEDLGYIIAGSNPACLKLDSMGSEVWRKEVGGLNICVRQTMDKGYIFCSSGGALAKLAPDPLDINSKAFLIIEQFSLSQNYPNPFNPSTSIEFDLPKTSKVTLKIFNILGEEVTTLVSERLSAGSYSYDWDASNLASGVYLYRLQAGDYVETRKMVLMR